MITLVHPIARDAETGERGGGVQFSFFASFSTVSFQDALVITKPAVAL